MGHRSSTRQWPGSSCRLVVGVSLLFAVTGTTPAFGQSSDQALSFGPPTVFENSRGLQNAAVLVTNNAEDVTGFRVTGNWVVNGEVVAQLTGDVSYLEPHQTRPIWLVTPVRNAIPETYDEVRFDTDASGLSDRSRTQAAVGDQITFDKPVISVDRFGFSTLALPVTNGDSVAHSLIMAVAYVKSGQIIGEGLGEVRDLGPSSTVTTTIRLVGTTADADQTIIATDTILS